MENRISQAIVMRVKDFGESDRLVTFLTPDAGCLKGVARAARRSRERFPNCLDLFSLSRMEYVRRAGGDLHVLHSCRLIEGFAGLRRDFETLALGSYMVEIVEMLSPPHDADPEMFKLLLSSLRLLEQGEEQGCVRLFFEAAAMALGGYTIDLTRCGCCGRPYRGEGRAAFKPEKGGIVCLKCVRESSLCPGLDPVAVQGIRLLQGMEWKAFRCMQIEHGLLQEISRVTRRHMDYRLGRRPKSYGLLGEER